MSRIYTPLPLEACMAVAGQLLRKYIALNMVWSELEMEIIKAEYTKLPEMQSNSPR
jgi:hypothetical protein